MPIARLLAISILAMTLAACGSSITRKAVPNELVNKVYPLGKEGLRQWGNALTPEELQDFLRQNGPRLKALYAQRTESGDAAPLEYLALSGGGQWGAFGAGVLRGWSDTGTRPQFVGVSGVSTGAIIAPFAFLGPEYDSTLLAIYSDYSTDALVEETIFSGLISGTALFDTSKLAKVIAKYVTPELLEKVAEEYAKGRYLFIGTTNLDAGRPVIWDIGAIASSGEPGALQLVRDLIRASAAIPVAFPPIFVEVQTADGRSYDEMHVDGGAASQVMFVSPQIPIAAMTRSLLNHNLDRRIWVIVNNDLEPSHQQINPRITSIASAAVSSLIRGSGAGDVYRLYAIAQRDEIDFNVTWIPSNVPCDPPTEDFDVKFMSCLYGVGRNLLKSGRLWRDAPPFFATSGADLHLTQ